jgi:trafficking protein particle complex subunit 9
MTTITRTQIANIASQAHGPWVMHLQPHDRIKVLSALAGFYSCLGFARKEVYILRELVSVVMDLIVLAREERREINAARMGANDTALSELTTSAHVTIREHQLTEGNQSILRLLTYICGVYGIDLKSIQLKNEMKSNDDKDWEKEAENIDFARQTSYGWAELQLGVVRESLAVAEALSGMFQSSTFLITQRSKELPALAQFSVSSLRTLFYHLTAQEQYSLYAAAKNAIQVSQRRGETIILEHWSGRPVVSVEVLA